MLPHRMEGISEWLFFLLPASTLSSCCFHSSDWVVPLPPPLCHHIQLSLYLIALPKLLHALARALKISVGEEFPLGWRFHRHWKFSPRHAGHSRTGTGTKDPSVTRGEYEKKEHKAKEKSGVGVLCGFSGHVASLDLVLHPSVQVFDLLGGWARKNKRIHIHTQAYTYIFQTSREIHISEHHPTGVGWLAHPQPEANRDRHTYVCTPQTETDRPKDTFSRTQRYNQEGRNKDPSSFP